MRGKRPLIPAVIGSVVLSASIAGSLPSGEDNKPSPDPGKELVPRLTSEVPADFFSPASGPLKERTLDRLQHDFDVYSWETFVALNWPVDDRGQVLANQKIGGTPDGDHRTVWETWKSTGELFLPDGEEPKKWGERAGLEVFFPRKKPGADATPAEKAEYEELLNPDQLVPEAGKQGPGTVTLRQVFEAPAKYRFITKMAKGHSWFATGQAFDTGPLIDQAGHYARFEILVNEDGYRYVRDNELYHEGGQEAFFDKKERRHVVFPIGRFKTRPDGTPLMDADKRPVNGPTGAILVKAAWKPLTEAERQSGRFHARLTLVYTPKDDVNGIRKADLRLMWLGLVGLHVVHKSQDVAQWTWSTFEHQDNCPDYKERAVTKDSSGEKRYSFYNPVRYNATRPEPDRQLNCPPPLPWNPLETAPEDRRSQIVRVLPITPDAEALNRQFQALLRKHNAKSVWQYYRLISTQWPTRPAGLVLPHDRRDGDVQKLSPADILGGPAPVFLANTALESYIQGEVPNASSSCMDCHANATTKSGPKGLVQFSDFAFILERARRRPAGNP